MLKGINIYFSHAELVPFSTSASVHEMYYPLVDTIPNQQILTRQVQQINPISHTIKSDSTHTVKPGAVHAQGIVNTQPVRIINPKDTSATIVYPGKLPFEKQRTMQDDQYFNNFMLGIPGKNISGHYKITLEDTFKVVADSTRKDTVVTQVVKPTGFIGIKRNVSIDWVPGFLLLSLFIFSWMKILYQKYVVQVVSSAINYQSSIRLFRERNVLFQNMALGLNFVFAINTGLFLHYLLSYFDLSLPLTQIQSVLVLSLGVIVLYNTKTITCRILGNIFSIKDDFAEYIHNINLYNKNIGLFLFPIVISFPYVTNEVKPILIYIGIAVVIGFFILAINRGMQIIVRKGSSVFFLILYLCAIEILPVLLLVKVSHTLI